MRRGHILLRILGDFGSCLQASLQGDAQGNQARIRSFPQGLVQAGGLLLTVPQAGVQAVLRQKKRMGAAFGHAAVRENQNFVGIDHG